MKALLCTGCGTPFDFDESSGKDYVYCSNCGVKIQVKDFVEIRHSGKVAVEGMASNERRVQMLYDYIDGLTNIDFNEIASGVLSSEEDSRVYLAYLLLNPEANQNYVKKYIRLVPAVTDFEREQILKDSVKYYRAFKSDKARVMYLLKNGLAPARSQQFILDQIMENNAEAIKWLLDNKVITTNSRCEFNSWRKVGLPDEYSAKKYGYRAGLDDNNRYVVLHNGWIPWIEVASNFNKLDCYSVLQRYKANEDRLKAIAKELEKEARRAKVKKFWARVFKK